MAIQSRIIDGRRVQIGSRAEERLLGQGFTPETEGATSARKDRTFGGIRSSLSRSDFERQNIITPSVLNSTATPYDVPLRGSRTTTDNLALANNSTVGNIRTDASYTPPVDTARQETQSYLQKIIGNIGDQAEDVERINKDAGLIKKKERAQAISTELDQLDKDYRDQIAEIKLNKEGKFFGGLQGEINQATDRYQNNRANIALTYKVAAEDYNGALEVVNQKVSALKDQNAQSLQAYGLLVDSINNDLTESEKLQVQANIASKKEQADTISDAYSNALKLAVENKAPASVLSAIDTAARSPNATAASVYASLGQYGGEGGGGDGSAASGDLEAYASQYADTGKLPSPSELKLSNLNVGQVTSYAKQLPKRNGALLSLSTGSKSSALSPSQEDGILALYDISQKVDQLKELEKARVKGLTSATLGKVFGFADQENYLNLRTEIIDLLARARTGAALTIAEEKFYKDQLPGRIGQVGFGLFGPNTQNKINNFGTKIRGTLETKLSGQGVGIYGFSKVKVGGTDRVIGEVIDIGGQQYRVLADGTLTDII